MHPITNSLTFCFMDEVTSLYKPHTTAFPAIRLVVTIEEILTIAIVGSTMGYYCNSCNTIAIVVILLST